ncbi:MAG: PAS domain-containing protein [Mucilaginibacter sp.]|nr:PAS domain-containing protein [Mucilaginibacter sp.]
MNPKYIQSLKYEVLVKANLPLIELEDCKSLAQLIFRETGIKISNTALQRLYGFTKSKFGLSFYALNILAIYCGSPSWVAFCNKIDDVKKNSFAPDPLAFALMETSGPLAILDVDSPDFTILAYNKAFIKDTHTEKREVKGLSWWLAFKPENAGGYGPTRLLEAFHEALYFQRTVQLEPVQYNIPSNLPVVTEVSWWDISVVPLKYDGKIKYLLLHINNITNKVIHQDAIEQAILKELTEAEDLAVTNVKLNNVIARLAESNQELFKTKEQLEKWVFERTKKLFESEDQQRKLIDHAPVAIAVLSGADHRVETANQKVISYWGKGPDILGKPLGEVLPEIESQGFIALLSQVRDTGISYVNPELRALISFDGVIKPRYFDMIYQPVQHTEGITDRIYIVAVDITDQVETRKALEASESLLRLALTAAGMGTWSLNLNTKAVTYDFMFATIIGWPSDKPMTYDQGISHVIDGSREDLNDRINDAIENNADLNAIYQARRFDDDRAIRIRVIGRVTVNIDGEKVLSGIIKEIPFDE